MPSPELGKYIQDAIKKGFTKEQIAAKLKEAGYSDAEIKKRIESADSTKAKNPAKENILLFFSVLLIVLVISVVLINIKWNNNAIFYMSKESDCNFLGMSSEEYLSCLDSNKLTIRTSSDCEQLEGEIRIVCESLAEEDTGLCDTIPSERYNGICEFLHVIKNRDIEGCEAFDEELEPKCLEIIEEHPGVINAGGFRFYFT